MLFPFAQTSYQKAKIIILGIPFDRTSSFIPGSRFAPVQIRAAFENVETYSPYQKQDLTSYKFHDAGDMVFSQARTESVLTQITQEANQHLTKSKRVLSLGGEHTITIPIVQTYKKFYPNLKVIQFDAHADWRDEYLGEKICHATTLRRVADIVGEKNVFQFGIRSMAQEESKKNIYSVKNILQINKLISKLGNAPIYLTLDIDVLDTGVMPAVATPEPGGCSFSELITALYEFRKCNIVGADLVEYNPLAASSFAYASTAAVLVREILLLLINKKPK